MDGKIKANWTLDPTITFLNHGSFGACPRSVLDVQTELRSRMEREPVRFFVREMEALLDAARAAVAAFVGAEFEDVVFVHNATTAVNAVLGSLRLQPGDELLCTNHGYNACNNALARVAERTGARVVCAAIPFPFSGPLSGPEEVVAAVLDAVTPRTRLCLLDHVTSPTGLVLPIEELCSALAARGIDTLVDGAHGPGMVPLRLRALGAAYYTGNLHKWCCAPKGAGFLFVRRDRQAMLHPAVTSHGKNSPRRDRSRYLLEFDWVGTDDYSAILAVPAALRFLDTLLPGGFAELIGKNRQLALAARRLLADSLGVLLPCPDEMIGALATVPLPASAPASLSPPLFLDPLQEALYARHGIEVPVIPWPYSTPPLRLLRISAQVYNCLADYERLAAALGMELAGRVSSATLKV